MEQAIRSIYIEQIAKAVISKIIIAVPFLGLPVINQIFTAVFYKVAKMAYDEIEELAVIFKIEFKVEGQKEEYEQATENLRNVLKFPDKTAEEIKRAKDEYKKKLRDLIMLTAV